MSSYQRIATGGAVDIAWKHTLAPARLASKHRRLSDQLDWAIVNSCFGEAVAFLENLGEDEWNVGSLDEWNADSYWKP